jgi:hypothetical protein
MFRAQNCLRAALLVAGLALVSLPASAQAGGGGKFYGNGCHSFNNHLQPTFCQPTFCQPTYCQPTYCQPVVTCRPVVTCQPIFVQPYCQPICQPQFPHCKPVIIHRW